MQLFFVNTELTYLLLKCTGKPILPSCFYVVHEFPSSSSITKVALKLGKSLIAPSSLWVTASKVRGSIGQGDTMMPKWGFGCTMEYIYFYACCHNCFSIEFHVFDRSKHVEFNLPEFVIHNIVLLLVSDSTSLRLWPHYLMNTVVVNAIRNFISICIVVCTIFQ